MYYESKRHETSGNPKPKDMDDRALEWRMKDRQRTVNGAIVLCLNIGVDPPDIIKTRPAAHLEAWINPNAINDPKKSIEQIGKQLQTQYEHLSTRTKYKQSLDPNVEDMKRFCMSIRRSARDERVLFHYNGHGVPRPTPSGEIWVFNRGYTQYIPVSVYDLQSWLGAPVIYAFDCHAAGHIVNNFHRFVEKRKADEAQEAAQNPAQANTNGNGKSTIPAAAYENCILLASCREDEVLPMHPDLPADLFTCCISSPIEIAVRWFVMQSPLKIEVDDLTIPGRISDRRTPLGELNWIFTAITDTIAWSTLDGALFKRLFRQDLVVAAMFRNFLLAERIMRVHNCHPVSSPKLPEMHDHPLWDAWDMAVHHCIAQLPALHAAERGEKPYDYKPSQFFEQQLTAFEYWLKYRSTDLDKPPEQLPVLLQVLLSQLHRLRALILLSKYLDLGPRAVHLALSIGIFPYVVKLLQSPAPELKPVLVFIWARVMAVDYANIQHELVKENGYAYFINILVPQETLPVATVNVYEHLAMCAFVLTLFCRNYRQGQRLCLGTGLIKSCLLHMTEGESPLLRQWSCLCLSQMWNNFPEAKVYAVKEQAPERLCQLLSDPVPEVRAACIVALTTFLSGSSGGSSSNNNGGDEEETLTDDAKRHQSAIALSVVGLINDASSIVRREVLVFYSKFVKYNINNFIVAAFTALEEDVAMRRDPSELDAVRSSSPAYGTPFMSIWKALLILTEDPFPEVADFAQDVVDYTIMELYKSALSEEAERLAKYLKQESPYPAGSSSPSKYGGSMSSAPDSVRPVSRTQSYHGNLPRLSSFSAAKGVYGMDGESPKPVSRSASMNTSPSGSESRLSSTLKRSVSFAASLKNFALGVPSPTEEGSKTAANAFEGANGSESTVTTIPYGSGKKPMPVRYTPRDKTTARIELPLSSGFFAWCCEYFQEPQMSTNETDEPGSERYTERMWKKSRNERIIAETQLQKELAVRGTWNNQVGFLNNITQPVKMVFAQFDPHLIVSDDRDGMTIWDWSEPARLNRFCNNNPVGTKITEVKLLNEDDHPILLTGSSEGVVRLYKHFQSPRNIELTSTWRVLSDLIPAQRNSGLVAEWQQSRGALYVGGDVKVIRLWDAPQEMCISDFPARSGSPITSLSSDQVSGNIFIAGFGDGAVRAYDRRVDPRDAMVRAWKKHNSWITNVHMQRGGARELVSGSTDGQVYLWDLRAEEPVVQFHAPYVKGNFMRAMDVHEHAPVIAIASQSVGIWSTNGTKVSSVRSPGGPGYMLANNRNTHVSSLAFHPHRMKMAVSNGRDAHISLFGATPRV